jgi:hypothetical protein
MEHLEMERLIMIKIEQWNVEKHSFRDTTEKWWI